MRIKIHVYHCNMEAGLVLSELGGVVAQVEQSLQVERIPLTKVFPKNNVIWLRYNWKATMSGQNVT